MESFRNWKLILVKSLNIEIQIKKFALDIQNLNF